MICTQFDELPAQSVAVHVRWSWYEPLQSPPSVTSLYVTVEGPHASVAVAVPVLLGIVFGLEQLLMTNMPGHVITGPVESSTVMV
jgi:hypothetical protein